MPKRIVDAHLVDGTVISYKIGLRPTKTAFTDDEYIGIAKQYHVEDGLSLETVDRWVVHPIGAGAPRKPPE
jgi:hypothetical protein